MIHQSEGTAPRHLKKAWLQRHNTDEDCENTSKNFTLDPNTLTTDSSILVNKNVEQISHDANTNPLCSVSPNADNRMTGIFNEVFNDNQLVYILYRQFILNPLQSPICLSRMKIQQIKNINNKN